MRVSTRVLGAAACVALVGWGATTEARAGGAGPPEEEDAATRAEAAWLAGRAALADGRPEHALLAFERAQALHPLPERHLRIAQTLELLGRHGEAADVYAAWLDARPEDPRADEVRRRLEDARSRAGRVLVLDGLDLTDGPAADDPPGVRLEPPPPAADPGTGGDGRVAPPSLTRRWWFWAGVGGAAAVLATGLAVAGGDAGDGLPAGTLGTIDRRTR